MSGKLSERAMLLALRRRVPTPLPPPSVRMLDMQHPTPAQAKQSSSQEAVRLPKCKFRCKSMRKVWNKVPHNHPLYSGTDPSNVSTRWSVAAAPTCSQRGGGSPGDVLSARAHERLRTAARRAVLYSAARTARATAAAAAVVGSRCLSRGREVAPIPVRPRNGAIRRARRDLQISLRTHEKIFRKNNYTYAQKLLQKKGIFFHRVYIIAGEASEPSLPAYEQLRVCCATPLRDLFFDSSAATCAIQPSSRLQPAKSIRRHANGSNTIGRK
ncbi:unnamed protein product, partial [Trichogramma brassicae]